MRLQLCTWPEVEAYLERSTGIIQPIGSTEQHGPTGFIGTDAMTGATRMTFDIEALSGGIPLIPLAIGVFAIPEVLAE